MKALATILFAAAFIAGCSGTSDDRRDNADEFRAKLEQIGYDVELQPKSEVHPGLVIGKATSEDGIDSSFAYMFGPAPERLPFKLERNGAVWIEFGDEANYWIEEFPLGLTPMESDRVLDMRFAIEDAGCQVVSGSDCRNSVD